MTDPVDALEALVKMRERGLVTDEEYQSKRADILARLGPPPAPASPPPAIATPSQTTPPVVDAKKAEKQRNQRVGCLTILAVIGLLYIVGKSSGDPRCPHRLNRHE